MIGRPGIFLSNVLPNCTHPLNHEYTEVIYISYALPVYLLAAKSLASGTETFTLCHLLSTCKSEDFALSVLEF